MGAAPGAVAEWLRSGLQSRVHQFDSGRRLSTRSATPLWAGFVSLCDHYPAQDVRVRRAQFPT